MRTKGWVFWAALALAGCGGGGGNPGTCNGSPEVCGGVGGTPPPAGSDTASGLYKGTTDTGRTAYTLVLDSGDFWILYGQPGNANVLGGFEQGTYNADDGDIVVPNLVDFSAASGQVANGTMTGTYVSAQRIAGTVRFGGEVASFAGTYDPNSTDDADLADAAGTYAGTLSVTDGSDAANVTVSSSGTVTGTSAGGCTITGTLLSNAGANSYNLNANLAGGICGNEGATLRGVAILQGTRIYAAGADAGRTEGFVFSGGR